MKEPHKSARTLELEEERKSLNERLDVVRDLLWKSQCEDWGIHIGDLVVHDSQTFKVRKIRFWSTGAPSLEGSKTRKDGSFGERISYIGTRWEKSSQAGLQVTA